MDILYLFDNENHFWVLKMTVLRCEVVTVVKLNCDLHSFDTVWC